MINVIYGKGMPTGWGKKTPYVLRTDR